MSLFPYPDSNRLCYFQVALLRVLYLPWLELLVLPHTQRRGPISPPTKEDPVTFACRGRATMDMVAGEDAVG